MYRIGTAARILGVPSETLRFFEQRGVVKAEKEESNGYRYFHSFDLNRINAYRFYRGMGFGMDEAITLLEASAFDLTSQMEAQMEWVRGQIDHYSRLLARITIHHKSLRSLPHLVGKFHFETRPSWHFLCHQEGRKFLDCASYSQLVQAWLEEVPFLGFALFIANVRDFGPGDILFGYCASPELGTRDTLLDQFPEGVREIDAQHALHTVIRTEDGEFLSHKHFEPALAFLNDEGYEPRGDVSGWILNEEKHGDKCIRHFEVWIPVKKMTNFD